MSDASANAGNPATPPHAPGGLAGGVDAMGDNALLALHERLAREKEEPSEGFSLIPIILIFVGCILTYLGGIDLAQHSGAFRGDVFDFEWTPHAETSGPVDMNKLGARVFADANCKNCHGPEGAGQNGAYPPLAGSPWVRGDARRAISVVLVGMNGSITVNGNTVSGGSMPNVGKGLSDTQVAAVLTYVRSNFGNQESPVDPALVGEVRAQLGGRSQPWSPDELLGHYPLGLPDPTAAAAPAAGTAPAAASGNAPAPAAASGSGK